MTDGRNTSGRSNWRRVVWALIFFIGGVASVAYGLTAADAHDVTYETHAGKPYTTYKTPWAYELVGGLLIVTGLGRLGMVWFQRRDTVSEPSPPA